MINEELNQRKFLKIFGICEIFYMENFHCFFMFLRLEIIPILEKKEKNISEHCHTENQMASWATRKYGRDNMWIAEIGLLKPKPQSKFTGAAIFGQRLHMVASAILYWLAFQIWKHGEYRIGLDQINFWVKLAQITTQIFSVGSCWIDNDLCEGFTMLNSMQHDINGEFKHYPIDEEMLNRLKSAYGDISVTRLHAMSLSSKLTWWTQACHSWAPWVMSVMIRDLKSTYNNLSHDH